MKIRLYDALCALGFFVFCVMLCFSLVLLGRHLSVYRLLCSFLSLFGVATP